MKTEQAKLQYCPKFADKMTRVELTEQQLHDIATALMSQAHNPQCAPDYQTYCYNLGRDFMELFTAKPQRHPLEDI
jgi:hypothetical protein